MITVLTSIVGSRDSLRDDFFPDGSKFIAYADQPSDFWEVRKPYEKFLDPVRNAKAPKILSHLHDDGSDVSIWLDGNITLQVPPSQLVDEFLGDKDFWLMTHFARKCLYEEGEACLPLEGDNRDVYDQMHRYSQEGMPKDFGLFECNVIIRRNTELVRRVNETWWAEVCMGSRRDQLSFTYALWKNGCNSIAVNTLKGNVREHPYFNYGRHKG